MTTKSQPVAGITHDVHVRTNDEEIQSFEGVLDVMKLPSGEIKFTHNGEMRNFSNGEVIRSRVTNVDEAHKYVCPECESEETALITSGDYGPRMSVICSDCNHTGLERREL